MSRAPAIQLYLKDWCSDQALRRCSLEAQGALMHVMLVLHQSDEYGVVRWPLRELAKVCGISHRFLRELSEKNVLKGSDTLSTDFTHVPRHAGKDLDPVTLVKADGGSCWFVARLVRDHWARNRRGSGSRFTAENQPSRSPTRPMGDRLGDGPASAFASAASIDSSKHTDSFSGEADDLARVLADEYGYSGCSGRHPELIRAKQAGVTPADLRSAALDKAGKPIAWLVARAIARKADQVDPTKVQPAGATHQHDPLSEIRKEISEIEDQQLMVKSDYDRGMIDGQEANRLNDPLVLRKRELQEQLAGGLKEAQS